MCLVYSASTYMSTLHLLIYSLDHIWKEKV